MTGQRCPGLTHAVARGAPSGLREAVKIGQPFEPEPGHAGGGKRRARARASSRRAGETTMSGTSRNIPRSTRARLPASRRVLCRPRARCYVNGTLHPFLRVPMREIAQTPDARPMQQRRRTTGAEVPNPPDRVYDTSGPYTDPRRTIDVRARARPACAREWIRSPRRRRRARDQLVGVRARAPRRRQARRAALSPRRESPWWRKPGATSPSCTTRGAGIITPEMEFVAIRENQRVAEASLAAQQHPGESLRRRDPAA